MRRRAVGAILAVLAAGATSQAARGQGGRGGSDAGEARGDALLGTPNRLTPVPQSNRFATTPGLEQQAPGPAAPAPVVPPAGAAAAGGDRR